ncbi:unnamed protein product [Auanema sp. JU1783]|nr:unnamed protein product [Auanema sp. JU1783]
MRTLLLLLASTALVAGLALPFRSVKGNADGAHKYSVQLYYKIPNQMYSLWVTNITVGTPGQTFLSFIDTTSSGFWVADASCDNSFSPGCYGVKMFYSNASSTYVPTINGTYMSNNTFGDSFGIVGVDNVKLGNDDAKAVLIPNTPFGQSDSLPYYLRNTGINSVLGIGFPGLTPSAPSPLFNDAIAKGVVKKGIITIWFEDQYETDDNGVGGTIYYGDEDPLHCTGTVNYTPLSRASLWQYTTPNVAVNGVRVSSIGNIQTIIDTTSNFITAPPQVVNAILSALKIKNSTGRNPVVPCNTKINLTFLMNNTAQTITELNLVTKDANGVCNLAIMKAMPKGTDNGIRFELGEPFIRGRCLFFDYNNEQIGFTDAGTHT